MSGGVRVGVTVRVRVGWDLGRVGVRVRGCELKLQFVKKQE